MSKTGYKAAILALISINLQAMEYQMVRDVSLRLPPHHERRKNIETLPDEILFQIFFEAITSGKLSDISTQYEILKKVNKKFKNILEDKSRSQKVEELEILIKQVKDLDFEINMGNSIEYDVLNKILRRDYEQLMKLLINKGININRKYNTITCNSLLHYSAMFNSIKIAEILIKNGININIENYDQSTPLHEAAGNFYSLDVAKLLINNGAKINILNSNGDTPLHNAAQSIARINSDFASRFLKSVGGDIASDRNKALKIAQHLINAGADLTIKNKKNETPIDVAKNCGAPEEIVKLLENSIQKK